MSEGFFDFVTGLSDARGFALAPGRGGLAPAKCAEIHHNNVAIVNTGKIQTALLFGGLMD